MFFVYFLITKICILVYGNDKTFHTSFYLNNWCFKKDYGYIISLAFVFFYTIFTILYDYSGNFISYQALQDLPLSTFFPKKELLHDYTCRHFLISVYKFVVIYISFSRKEDSTYFRLIAWFFFTIFLNLSSS